MTVGDRIKIQREAMNISQTDLANKIGISKQTLYKYEKNIVTNIPQDKIVMIASELSTTPQYLMGWLDNGENPKENLTETQQALFDFISRLDEERARLAIRILRSLLDDKE